MIPEPHHPPHIYLDNTIYFLSVHTHEDSPLLIDNRKKELLKLYNKQFKNNKYKLHAYVFLNEHYHLLFKTSKGGSLSNIIKNVHGALSFKWNGEDNKRGRQIFQNYWDYCTRDEKDFWTHFNYIHNNPIKHGLFKNLEELKNYKFCSYCKWLNEKGEEWMGQCFENYPVIDFIIPND